MIPKYALMMAAMVGLLAATSSARAHLKIVATVPTLAAVAKAIGGSKVSVQSLALHTQDPHFVDAKPSRVLKLNKADLLLVVGLQLEVGWLPTLQTGARNKAIQVGSAGYLDCSQFVKLKEIPKVVDRRKGDIHPGGNPHYLYDPRAVVAVAKAVTKRMGVLDTKNAAFYRAKLKRFVKRVKAVAQKQRKQLKKYRGLPIIGYHKSWAYLADWLGLKQIAFIEPKPGIPPNPAHVAKVLVLARKKKVRAILQESYYPNTTTKLIAKKSGARLVTVPGGVNFKGGEKYWDHLEKTIAKLKKGLKR